MATRRSKDQKRHQAVARKCRRNRRKAQARVHREGVVRGTLIQEAAAAAFRSLRERGWILWFQEFQRFSREDLKGWDFLILLLDGKFVPVDVTTNSRRNLERKFSPAEQKRKWKRLILPLDVTDLAISAERLADKILSKVQRYEPKLSRRSLKNLNVLRRLNDLPTQAHTPP